jgi:hypothetical protein
VTNVTSTSSASAARSRASYDFSSELSRICTALRDLGGYCRGGIVDVCMSAANNFFTNHDESESISWISVLSPAVRSSAKYSSGDVKPSDTLYDDWDHLIYHGRPSLTDDVLLRARKECYNCLIHHFLQIIHITRFYPSIASSNETHTDSLMSPTRNRPAGKSVDSNMNITPSDDFEPTLQDMINDPVYAELLLTTLLKECPKHLIQLHKDHTKILEEFLMDKDPLVLYR